MPSLDLAIALRIIRGRPHMTHPTDPDELLKVSSNELRPIVRDDSGTFIGIFFLGPLKDDLHIGFGHGFSDLPMHNETAVSIQDACQVIEGAPDVQIRDINVPVFMRPRRTMESVPFGRCFAVPLLQQPSL